MGNAYYDELYCLLLDSEEGGWVWDLKYEVEEYAAYGFLHDYTIWDFEDWRDEADNYFDGEDD